MIADDAPHIPRWRPRAAAISIALAAVTSMTALRSPASGQHRLRASGQRLLSVQRHVVDSEGDRHALRTRLPDAPLTRASLHCVTLPRGRTVGTPIVLGDRRVAVVTQSPAEIHWIQGGRLLRSVEVGVGVVGTGVEGPDGRLIVNTETPSIRAYAPDGTLYAQRPLPARPINNVGLLTDGTLLVPVEGRNGTDVLVMTPDLSLQDRVSLGANLVHTYFYRGENGALWFNTSLGPSTFDGEHPLPEPLRWARGAYAAWQIDEDALVVQYGSSTPADLRFTSRTGVVRGSATLQSQIFLLPRGHLGLAQPVADRSTPPQGSDAGTQPLSPLPSSTRAGRGSPGGGIGQPPTRTELVVLDRRGAVVSRALLSPEPIVGALLDPDDSLLAITASGEAFHIDPGGAVRWQASLAAPPLVDVVALPWGGFAMNVQMPRSAVCTYEP
jgi:hypothetical protein